VPGHPQAPPARAGRVTNLLCSIDRGQWGAFACNQPAAYPRAEAERRGWLVVGLLSDAGASGSSMRRRPALAEALALVDHGQGDVLAVAKLDRLSRSVLDFAQLMVRARDLGWGR